MLSKVVIQKYGSWNIETIDEHQSNFCWRWVDIQTTASLVTDKLLWQIGSGNRVFLRFIFWWKPTGPIPSQLNTIRDLRLGGTRRVVSS